MTGAVRQMLTCHWAARRIQRWLDDDPAAPPTPGEIVRLEDHVATRERCREVARQHARCTVLDDLAVLGDTGGQLARPAARHALRTLTVTRRRRPGHRGD